MTSWLRKIFQPKTVATFENNKYDIDAEEYKQLKADMEKAGVKFGHKEKVAFKQAVRTGQLGAYMDAKEIDAKFHETLSLSLSTKIGKADATQDIEEAKSLAKMAGLDCNLKKVLKHLEEAKEAYSLFEETNIERSNFFDEEFGLNRGPNFERSFSAGFSTFDEQLKQVSDEIPRPQLS